MWQYGELFDNDDEFTVQAWGLWGRKKGLKVAKK